MDDCCNDDKRFALPVSTSERRMSIMGMLRARFKLQGNKQQQEFPYPLTCWQQTVSALVFLAYAAIGMVLRVLTWPVRKFGYALAVGFGARMLSSNEYKHLWLSAHNLGWVRFQTAAEQRGLMHLFDEQHPNLRKCWTEALNVIIIVSGLLTTSSYQALFSGYPGDASTGAVATLQSCFRAANAISFLASVVTIVVSALLIMALHKFASLDGQSITLTPWSRALLYLGYQLAVYAFFASLAAALAAVGFASYGFFADNGTLADSIVLWCVLWVSVSLVVIGGLVTAIRPVKQKERRKSVSTGRSAATSPVDSKPSALGCTTPDPKPDAGGGEVQVDLRLHLLAVLIAQKLERLIESQQSMELALKDFTKAARQSPLLEGDSAVSVRPSIVDPSRIGRAALGLDVSLRLPSLSDMRPALRKPEHMNMRRLKP